MKVYRPEISVVYEGAIAFMLAMLLSIPWIVIPPMFIGIINLRDRVVELEDRLDRISGAEAPEMPVSKPVRKPIEDPR